MGYEFCDGSGGYVLDDGERGEEEDRCSGYGGGLLGEWNVAGREHEFLILSENQ